MEDFRAHEHVVGESNATASLGKLYARAQFSLRDIHIAEKFLVKALVMFEGSGMKKELYETHAKTAELYKETKQWELCAHHLEQHHKLYVEVQSEEASKQSLLFENRRNIENAERDRQVKLARFQEQERVLHNILPAQIAERILDGEQHIADSFESVSIFFSDIVDFTNLSRNITADELVSVLNDLFVELDRLARRHSLEKIKTIGDSYMAVAGVPVPQSDHAERAAQFAVDVQKMMHRYRGETQRDIRLRMGLHCGTVVAGVIGESKFSYDLWGDAVHTASRMESHGMADSIHCSEEFAMQVRSRAESFVLSDRGIIDIKGKGKMRTYFLEGVES